jgi:DNA-3-methyladenine glycosylase I
MPSKQKKRCQWVKLSNPLYVDYHDNEWGRPVHDDNLLFEFLILEGAQAGLSWETILNKRASYREAFDHFDPAKVARYTEARKKKLLQNPGIVRNKMKVKSATRNAKVFLDIQKEFGSFDQYVWGFVGGKPIINKWKTLADIPVSTPESDALSKDLKKRGMNFVGTTIMYAFMQAIGMVNDHTTDCFCYPKKMK